MMTTNHPSSNPSKSTSPIFTPLEQEILDEYSLLLDNLNNVSYAPPPSFPPPTFLILSLSFSSPQSLTTTQLQQKKKKITT